MPLSQGGLALLNVLVKVTRGGVSVSRALYPAGYQPHLVVDLVESTLDLSSVPTLLQLGSAHTTPFNDPPVGG